MNCSPRTKTYQILVSTLNSMYWISALNSSNVRLQKISLMTDISNECYSNRMGRYLIYVLYLQLFLVSFLRAANVKFESKELADKQFIESNKSWILERYKILESYFHVDSKNSLNIQIMPVTENENFTSCARIYGENRIYAHSPKSLKALKPDQRKKYNPFCFERDYEDLKYTLVHEYVHILTLKQTKKNLPQWIWEGAAVALSGQLDHTQMGSSAKNKLKGKKELNICESSFLESDPYLIGGSVINFLESKSPGIAFELLQIQDLSDQKAIQKLLKQKKISCLISTSEIIAVI